MEFFDKLGKKATEAYKITADKTGRLAKETKLKIKISDLKSQINDLYEEIGKNVYQKHIREDEEANKEIEEDISHLCTKIDVLSDEIDSLLEQCLELKDRKQCKNCYKEIDKNDKYCPNCGAKQEDEKISGQEEIKEEPKEEQKEENNQEQENNKEENEESKENLEKTVAVESHVETDEDNEDVEDNYSEEEN
mgnify:FL=1